MQLTAYNILAPNNIDRFYGHGMAKPGTKIYEG